MIKSLLKLGLLLLVGIVGYNYFLGDTAEKASARNLVNEVKDVGREIGGLIKSEREKFDKGKYDKALVKLKDVYDGVKDKAQYLDKKYMSRLDELSDRRNDLENRLSEVTDDNSDEGKKQAKRLTKDLDKLLEETKNLVKEIE